MRRKVLIIEDMLKKTYDKKGRKKRRFEGNKSYEEFNLKKF